MEPCDPPPSNTHTHTHPFNWFFGRGVTNFGQTNFEYVSKINFKLKTKPNYLLRYSYPFLSLLLLNEFFESIKLFF